MNVKTQNFDYEKKYQGMHCNLTFHLYKPSISLILINIFLKPCRSKLTYAPTI
jgi:hypothetical protein